MGRHRGRYNPLHTAPYELSRSKMEMFVRCEACFWLEKVAGVKQPGMPAFLINSLTDLLLKREMDEYRGIEAHPFATKSELDHLIPLDHADLEDWTDSLQFGASPKKYNTLHKPTNILFGGGIDDMWLSTKTGEYVLVDFKSTANLTDKNRKMDLDGPYKAGYKRQMDIYLWIGRQRGYPMSEDTYFLYVDGINKRFYEEETYEGSNEYRVRVKNLTMRLDRANFAMREEGSEPVLHFKPTLIHYKADDSWVEPTLFKMKETLEKPKCPEHSEDCEHGRYLKQTMLALDMIDEPVCSIGADREKK